MTNKEKQLYLEKYMTICSELEEISEQIERRRSQSEKITQMLSITSMSKTSTSKIESAVEELELLAIELVKKQLQEINTKVHIEKITMSIADAKLQEIIKLKYLKGYKLNEIANKMNYSYRQIQRLHHNAIRAISL